MFRNPARRCGVLAAMAFVATGLVVGACHHGQGPRAQRTTAPASASSAPDLDAVVLADVDDARSDLAQRQPLAAFNDVNRAFDNATRLQDASPVLYPNEGAAPGVRTSGLTAFDVFVRLTSIQGQLQAGDNADADAGLAAIEAGTPAARLPVALPLVRAAESLKLAQIAVESERPGELAAELRTAQAALAAYHGRRQADAEALAASIRAALSRPGALATLQADLLQSWASRVDGWL